MPTALKRQRYNLPPPPSSAFKLQHCTGSGQHVDPDTGFTPSAFQNTSSAVDYIGEYGSADPLDVSQWMELQFSSSADTASWDDERWVPPAVSMPPSGYPDLSSSMPGDHVCDVLAVRPAIAHRRQKQTRALSFDRPVPARIKDASPGRSRSVLPENHRVMFQHPTPVHSACDVHCLCVVVSAHRVRISLHPQVAAIPPLAHCGRQKQMWRQRTM